MASMDSTAPPGTVERLRNAGLKVTAPRLAVLRAVDGAAPHPDVEDIATAARTSLGTLSTKTVYENLRVLADAGLVRRIEPAGSPARFETRVGDNHHHLVCRGCGVVADVDCAVGAMPCLEPSDAAGFALDEAEVTFWGLCPHCQTTDASLSDTVPTSTTPSPAANPTGATA